MPSHTHNVGYRETNGNYVPKGVKALWSFRTESDIYTPAINGVLTDMAPHGYATTHFNQNTAAEPLTTMATLAQIFLPRNQSCRLISLFTCGKGRLNKGDLL